VARFYCERWTGLSIWAHALGRMIAFTGGYLNTENPAEIAFVRATDYFKRGMIVEQSNSQTVPTGPPVPRGVPASWLTPSKDPPRSSIYPSALSPMPFRRPSLKHDRAAAWLRAMLRDGHPMPVSWMMRQAQLAHISLRTLRRARMTAGVVATKEGMTGGWTWTLPSDSHGLLR
jgi:hypothetical protein